MEKKTKILCTIGPASWTKEKMEELYKAGMNVARLNFSHQKHDEARKLIGMIREISPEIAILLDTKGPEVRTGVNLDDKKNEFVTGDEVIFTNEEVLGTNKKMTINYEFLGTIEVGCTILIDDGLLAFEVVEKVDENSLKVKCLNGGKIGSRKTCTIWGHEVKLPFLLQKDIDDILFGCEMGVDFVAASFVRTPEEVRELRKLLDENGGENIHIISKIEHGTAIKNLEEIVRESNGIMVARGDLAVEVPLEDVPELQIKMIDMCRQKGKPVIVATQMLDSMQDNPRPTRAEIGDVANAIMQGADAVMLSGETANGDYPVLSVETMSKIARKYDDKCTRNLNRILDFSLLKKASNKTSVTKFIAKMANDAAEALEAAAIIIPTNSGFTVRNVSRFRPNCPIFALTSNMTTLRQLKMSKGVQSINYEVAHTTKEEAAFSSIKHLASLGKLKEDDKVIVVSGFKIDNRPHTNLVEVYDVCDVLNM